MDRFDVCLQTEKSQFIGRGLNLFVIFMKFLRFHLIYWWKFKLVVVGCWLLLLMLYCWFFFRKNVLFLLYFDVVF